MCVCAPFTGGLLDWLHGDDSVCAGGFLHCGRLHPDDCVGQRQTPKLFKGVQRLSNPPCLHTPLHLVESHAVLHTSNPSLGGLPFYFFIFLVRAPPSIWMSVRVCAEVNSMDTFWSYGVHLTFSCISKERQLQDWWTQDWYFQSEIQQSLNSTLYVMLRRNMKNVLFIVLLW